MLRIAVCDDSQDELKIIRHHLDAYQKARSHRDIEVVYFPSSKELLAYKDSKSSFHIYLLDILMPDINGIELGKEIRRTNRDSAIVYLTSSKDFALESFSVFALQYLIKPVEEGDLFTALDTAADRLDLSLAKSMAIKTGQGIVSVHFHNVAYVEYSSHVLHFHLGDGSSFSSSHVRVSFEDAVDTLLADERFLHPHKSYVINMNYVKRISAMGLIMQDEAIIPIPRKNASAVKKEYLHFLSLRGQEVAKV